MYVFLWKHSFLTHPSTTDSWFQKSYFFLFSLQLHPRCTTLEPYWHSQIRYLSQLWVSLFFFKPESCTICFQIHISNYIACFWTKGYDNYNFIAALYFSTLVTRLNCSIVVANYWYNFFWKIIVLHSRTWFRFFFLIDVDETISFSIEHLHK